MTTAVPPPRPPGAGHFSVIAVTGSRAAEVARALAGELTVLAAAAFAAPPWNETPAHARQLTSLVLTDAGHPAFVLALAFSGHEPALAGFCYGIPRWPRPGIAWAKTATTGPDSEERRDSLYPGSITPAPGLCAPGTADRAGRAGLGAAPLGLIVLSCTMTGRSQHGYRWGRTKVRGNRVGVPGPTPRQTQRSWATRVDAEPGDVLALANEQLRDPWTGWSIGTFGAIAEFTRDADEDAELATSPGAVAVSTARGAIRIVVSPQLRPVAFERPAGAGPHWAHSVALCLPEAASVMSRRTVITELGPDTGAVRAQDRGALLFDLGLGAVHVDACVRTRDPQVVACLRAAAGSSLLDPATGVAAALASLHPHRVFASRAGRVEVFTPIPPPDGTSPEGPHTHLLPAPLASRRSYPHTDPIPPGWLPAAYVVPAHPTADLLGRPVPFDRDRYDRFQDLLRRYGDAAAVAAKSGVIRAVLDGEPPPRDAPALPRATRRAAVLALRQLTYLSADPTLLRRWAEALGRQARHLRGPRRGAPMSAGTVAGAADLCVQDGA